MPSTKDLHMCLTNLKQRIAELEIDEITLETIVDAFINYKTIEVSPLLLVALQEFIRMRTFESDDVNGSKFINKIIEHTVRRLDIEKIDNFQKHADKFEFTKDFKHQRSYPFRDAVWLLTFGNIMIAECPICRTTIRVTSQDWCMCHVHSKYDGGSDELENMRVLCAGCNRMMGKRNMYTYCKTLPNSREIIDFLRIPSFELHEQQRLERFLAQVDADYQSYDIKKVYIQHVFFHTIITGAIDLTTSIRTYRTSCEDFISYTKVAENAHKTSADLAERCLKLYSENMRYWLSLMKEILPAQPINAEQFVHRIAFDVNSSNM